MLQHEFNKNAIGSYYTLATDAPDLAVIFMHGAGGSAAKLRGAAENLQARLP